MAGVALADPHQQYFDASGAPLAGGFVHIYLAGTTTRTNTWQDRDQTTLNTNPIELDASGSCLIVLDTSLTYKRVVTDADGVVQSHLSADNMVGAAGASVLSDALADIETARADAMQDIQDQQTTSVAAVEAAQATAETAVDALVTQAETAQTATETARDAAFAATKIYANTAAGVAGVASGEYFYVPSSDAYEGLILYLDNTGTASEQKRFLSSSGVQRVAKRGEMVEDRSAIYPWLKNALIFGDSRSMQGQRKWKNGGVSVTNGLDISSGFVGPGHAEATNGTLEYQYNGGDKRVRWTANGDTAGPWVPFVAGLLTLDSGTAGTELQLELPVKSTSSAPTSDTSVTISVSGSLYWGHNSNGPLEWAMHYLRWPFQRVYNAGIGGSTTANSVEQLQLLRWRAAGPGVAFILLGTNDISGSVASATTIANLTTIYDRLASQGLRLVIVGEHARWGTAAGVPMTAGQVTIFDAVRAFQQLYANQYGHLFVDTYSLTYDSGASDRRPLSDMLSDHVHPSTYGAQIIGDAIADSVAAWLGRGKQIDSTYDNALSVGFFSGSSGGTGTGGSGTVPTGWSISRASGSDATIASSLVARTDGVTGNWWKLVVASTAGSQILQPALQSPSSTLSALGLAVGDEVEASVEFRFENLTNVAGIRAFIQLLGSSGTRTIMLNYGLSTDVQSNGSGVMKAPRFTIPTGTTNLSAILWIHMNASGSGDVYLANFRYRKIAQEF